MRISDWSSDVCSSDLVLLSCSVGKKPRPSPDSVTTANFQRFWAPRFTKWKSCFGNGGSDVSRPQRNLIASLRGRMTPDTQQSAEVQANLVKSLYASPASLMIGAVAGGALGLVIAWHAKLTAITVIAILICLVGLSRSISAVYFHRQLAHQHRVTQPIWGLAYELGAWGYAALLGILAFATLMLSGDIKLHTLSVCLVAAYSGGIAGRNAGRIHIAVGQTCFALLPTCLGLVMSGGLGYRVLATMLFLMIFAMAEITKTTQIGRAH